MGRELYEQREVARDVFAAVSDATGRDTVELCFNTDEETLRQTQNAQLALYTVGVAAFKCLDRHLNGVVAIDAFAGHSVGEYAALTAAGILSVEDGARIVQRRGELMAEAGHARPGGMAAVLGLDKDQVQAVLDGYRGGVVVIANDNCPGQLVISGDLEGVLGVASALQDAGAKRVLPLNVSGAFHSPLMEESAWKLDETLRSATFGPGGRVFSNVTAQPVVVQGKWPELLGLQLKSPVRWTETIQNMFNEGTKTFVECGVGDVLSGLIKRIEREAKSYRVQDLVSLEETVVALR
jgi:[acyl-carrier-protein] S-malonyltransferase